jgi:cellulose synthase/poly-beta-1,6-N-acetylglucosamine synthase-like glycosyltransferase
MVIPLSPYRHTQRSSVLPWILALTAGFVVLAVLIWIALVKPAIITEIPPATAKWILFLVIIAWAIGMSILSWYFSSMTVDVTDDELRWRFAGGQGYRIARAEINNVRIVPHRWWAGYGIEYFGPKRWTYVIGGCETVEVSLKSGGWRRLGTDDPHGLHAVLTSSTR